MRENLIKKLIRLIQPPSLSLNTAARKNYRKFSGLILKNNPAPLILCLGSGEKGGVGMSGLDPAVKQRLVNLDITALGDIDVAGDGHYLPFKREIFDGVIIQAVLEHVRYPVQVISEAKRILKPGGYLYVETPFLQTGHGETDYQRYTLEGLKLLLSAEGLISSSSESAEGLTPPKAGKDFRLIEAGICVGPASAFINNAQACFSLIFSFNSEVLWKFWRIIFGWLLFPFKYLDLIISGMKEASLSAGAFYCIGQKQ